MTLSLERVDDVLEAANRDHGYPALAAAVARRDGVIATGAAGVARAGGDQQISPESRFHIGSISKSMSATAIGTLVEDALLRWESTPLEVLPELEGTIHPAFRRVRLEHLLAHRAGIMPLTDDAEIEQLPAFSGSPTEQRLALALTVLQREPSARPVEEYLYSNAGYAIAAAMAERAVGIPWERLVRERLFEPLGLRTAGFGWPALDHPGEPWGHYKREDRIDPHPPDDVYQLGPLIAPAGDVHMSMPDLAEFGRMHLLGLAGADTLVSAETMKRLHTPFGQYALGWNEDESSSQHTGSAETFFAVLLLLTGPGLVVAYACNAAVPPTEDGETEDVELARKVVRPLVRRYTAA